MNVSLKKPEQKISVTKIKMKRKGIWGLLFL
jgi:hypothetical protein